MLIVYADGIGTAKIPPEDERSILLTVAKACAESLRGKGHHVGVLKAEWPASMATVGGPLSWVNAAYRGVLAIDNILADHPGERIILLGYSGGCRVVHDWLDTRPGQLDRIAAVGLMSDPFRPEGKSQDGRPPLHGWGICGQRPGPVPGRTFWTGWNADVITCCSPDNPLRTGADVSDRIPGGFLDDVGDHLELGNWQLANYMKVWRRDPLAYLLNLPRRMNDARWGIHGYLTGEHTRAYIEKRGHKWSLAEHLGLSVAWAVHSSGPVRDG